MKRIIVYVKDYLVSCVKVMKYLAHDVIWLYLDRHFFNMDTDLIVGACYIPGEKWTYQGISEKCTLDGIVQDLVSFENS